MTIQSSHDVKWHRTKNGQYRDVIPNIFLFLFDNIFFLQIIIFPTNNRSTIPVLDELVNRCISGTLYSLIALVIRGIFLSLELIFITHDRFFFNKANFFLSR